MKKQFYFFSTRRIENLYNFIVPVACNHAEKYIGKKLKIIYPKKYVPSLNFLIFILKIFLNRSFFRDKDFVNLHYSGYLIGRYVLSHSMRYAGYYQNKITFSFYKLKYLIVVDKIVQNIENIPEETKAVYVDHGMYLNGIYFQGFQKKKLIIYTNNFPKGFCSFDFRHYKKKIIQYSNLMSLNKKYSNKKKILDAKKKISLITNKTTTIPWMKKASFKNMRKIENLKKVSHIVYAHSFFEAQYMYGYDDFISYEEWLEFTINELINKKNLIIIKAHPSFFIKDSSDLNSRDISIFNKIKKKYSNFKNIIFIDYPLQNNQLLKKVNKKAIVISRHSTAIVEAVYLGFKVISSSENFWNTKILNISNHWKNHKEYKQLLSKPWSKLIFSNQKDFYSLSYDLFCQKSFNLGQNYFISIISRYFQIPINKLSKLINYKLNNLKEIKKIQNRILKKSIWTEIL